MNTDTIYTVILSVTATVASLFALPRLVEGTRRLATRLRTRYRAAIGMENFEALVIDEMRTYRSDVDRWSREVRADMREHRSTLQARSNTLSAHGARVNSTKREVEELGILLNSYVETLGPIWNTAQGHRMPMRLLSTGHLQNIIEGGFGSWEARDFARVELERRAIDGRWREAAQRGEKAPTKEDYQAFHGVRPPADPSEAMGRARRAIAKANPMIRTQLSVHPDTLERVRNVLPLWAQNVITDLRTRRAKRLDMETRNRLEVLPVWARELIADLIRRGNA